MATWREQLRPASFRGVPFEVETDSSAAGRRTQTHEFVQRDAPFVEDLGRKTREFKLVGFVCGADCLQKRDALLAVLDQPGQGELIHPWLGKMNVTAADGCEYSHDRREGGVVRFTLVFVEAGEKGFPVAKPNTPQQVVKAKAGLVDEARERFKAVMDGINTGRAKITAAQRAMHGVYNTVAAHFGEIGRTIGSAAAFVDTLLTAPASYLGLFKSLSNSVTGLGGSRFNGFSTSLQALLGKAESVKALSTYSYAGDALTSDVVRAGQRLARDALLADIADDAAAIPVYPAPPAPPATPSVDQQVTQPIERDEVPVMDDVLVVRDAVNEAFWAAELDADHAQFEQLEATRKAIYRHLTAVAAAGVRLVEYAPGATEPALVTAYRLFGDASRGGEIVTRNRLRHPGFVPPVALQVAQE